MTHFLWNLYYFDLTIIPEKKETVGMIVLCEEKGNVTFYELTICACICFNESFHQYLVACILKYLTK